MRIKGNNGEGEEQVNMTPLIDMVFLLLIFFLVATTVAQDERELDIQLLETSAEGSISDVPKTLVVNIDSQGRYIIRKDIYSFDELRDEVQRLAEFPERDVVIRGDNQSQMEPFNRALALVHESGINDFRVAYLSRNEDAQ